MGDSWSEFDPVDQYGYGGNYDEEENEDDKEFATGSRVAELVTRIRCLDSDLAPIRTRCNSAFSPLRHMAGFPGHRLAD